MSARARAHGPNVRAIKDWALELEAALAADDAGRAAGAVATISQAVHQIRLDIDPRREHCAALTVTDGRYDESRRPAGAVEAERKVVTIDLGFDVDPGRQLESVEMTARAARRFLRIAAATDLENDGTSSSAGRPADPDRDRHGDEEVGYAVGVGDLDPASMHVPALAGGVPDLVLQGIDIDVVDEREALAGVVQVEGHCDSPSLDAGCGTPSVGADVSGGATVSPVTGAGRAIQYPPPVQRQQKRDAGAPALDDDQVTNMFGTERDLARVKFGQASARAGGQLERASALLKLTDFDGPVDETAALLQAALRSIDLAKNSALSDLPEELRLLLAPGGVGEAIVDDEGDSGPDKDTDRSRRDTLDVVQVDPDGSSQFEGVIQGGVDLVEDRLVDEEPPACVPEELLGRGHENSPSLDAGCGTPSVGADVSGGAVASPDTGTGPAAQTLPVGTRVAAMPRLDSLGPT